MKNIIYIVLTLAAVVSCSKNEETHFPKQLTEITPAAPFEKPTDIKDLKEVAHFIQNNHKITLKTISGSLNKGYNDLYITISDLNNKALAVENVSFLPMMRMYSDKVTQQIGHSHSCPHTSDFQKINKNHFRGYAIFQMNTGDTGHWDITFEYTIEGKFYQMKEKQVQVKKTELDNHLKIKRFKANSQTYMLALISPVKHRMGRNTQVVAGLFRVENPISFALVKGYKLSLDPRMPGKDMQNHSTPFGDFVEQQDGFHIATINYSMSGNWVLNFIIRDQNQQIIAGNEVPKIPATTEDYDKTSDVNIPIEIQEEK